MTNDRQRVPYTSPPFRRQTQVPTCLLAAIHSLMPYQSPISPGRSWYEETAGERPEYPSLAGDTRADVAIVGGGFTGLSAALHLARAGVDVVLVDAHRFGDGASGRNGGQLGTGQRAWPEEMERDLGFTRAKALFDLAEEAKAHLLE